WNILAVCARNRSLIGRPFSANWDTWGFDDPHTHCEDSGPAPAGLSLKVGGAYAIRALPHLSMTAPLRRGLFLLALHDLGLDRRCPKGQSLQASGQDFQLVRRTQVVEVVNARLHDLKVLRGDVVGRDAVTLTHGRLRCCLAGQSFCRLLQG